MTVIEYLDACKKALGIATDYALAQKADLDERRINDWRKGKGSPDVYACFKFAEILGKSPSVVLAELQAQTARTEGKRLFFQRFFMIAGLWILLGFASLTYSPTSEAALVAGKPAVTDISPHYAKSLIKLLKRFWSFLSVTLRVTGHVKLA